MIKNTIIFACIALVILTSAKRRQNSMVEKTLSDIAAEAKYLFPKDTDLHKAAHLGDFQHAFRLITNGASVNILDGRGRTPLHVAAKSHQWRIIQLLLDHGAQIDSRDKSGLTPATYILDSSLVGQSLQFDPSSHPYYLNRDTLLFLHEQGAKVTVHQAAYVGDLKAIKGLFAKGIDVNQVDKHGNTPMHFAAWGGYLGVVRLLLEYKAQLNCRNKYGYTPIQLALQNDLSVAFHLYEKEHSDLLHTSQQNIKNSTKCHYNTARMLLANGAQVSLPEAAYLDSYQTVHELINIGTSIDSKSKALYYSARIGNPKLVSFLLDRGAPINGHDRRYNPLLEALNEGHSSIAEMLILKGADIHRTKATREANTAIHLAAREGLTHLIELLLAKGVDVNTKNEYGNTALHDAVLFGKSNVVKYLIKHGADANISNSEGERAVEIAMRENQQTIAALLLGSSNRHNLHLAAYVGSVKIAEALSVGEANIDSVDDYGQTPLHYAINNGHIIFIDWLLAKGADIGYVDDEGNTYLHHAAHLGHSNLVSRFLQDKQKINIYNHMNATPLHLAAGYEINGYGGYGVNELVKYSEEHDKIAKSLIKNGANIWATTYDGVRVIDAACRAGRRKIVELLLIAGDSVDTRGEDGYSPLHFAVQGGHRKLVAFLLDKGADANAPTDFGITPLHEASYLGHRSIAMQLIYAGADVNAVDSQGNTPLHWAAVGDHQTTELIDLLLLNGANVNTPNLVSNNIYNKRITKPSNLIRFFLGKGYLFHTSTKYSQTPLDIVLQQRNLQVFCALKPYRKME